MLSALNIGSTSSGSPAIASDPPTPAVTPAIPQAQFYIEVPPPPRFPTPPPATTEAAAPPLSPILSPAPTTTRSPIFLPNAPLPPPSSPAPAPSPALAALLASVAAASGAAGSSAAAGSSEPAAPAAEPFVRPQLVVPAWRMALRPPPPSRSTRSRQRRNDSGPTQEQGCAADLLGRIQGLERTMDEFREWAREDREWKREIDERLKRANL